MPRTAVNTIAEGGGGVNAQNTLSTPHNVSSTIQIPDDKDQLVYVTGSSSWTSRAAAEANSWLSVCWSPERGLFVAVANSGTNRAMTSPDGITWTARTAAAANNWYSVCWSPERGLFVAVATSGTNLVMTSPDGIIWTARAAAALASCSSVCWSSERGLFVAVATTGTNRVMTSPDGITWTARTAAEANSWLSVCWSPERGMFVAVAISGTNRVMTLDLAQLNASPIQNGQKEGQKLILVGTDNYNTPELKTVGNLDVQKDSSDSSIAVSYQQEYELNWDSINNQWIRVK